MESILVIVRHPGSRTWFIRNRVQPGTTNQRGEAERLRHGWASFEINSIFRVVTEDEWRRMQ